MAAIGSELTRLEEGLLAAGPDTPIDFFGEPGTTGQVARLLAHEAIGVAHAASLAAGRATPDLSPAVATDGVDRALAHWAEPDAHVAWRPDPVVLRATDTAQSWYLECGSSGRGDHAAFRPTGTRRPGAVVVLGRRDPPVVDARLPHAREPARGLVERRPRSSMRCGWGWATTWRPRPAAAAGGADNGCRAVGGAPYRGAMTRLTPEAYLDHIRAESARFRAVLADADPAARVPSCPDWDAADLLWHLAKVQRFWAGAVPDRPAEPAEGEEAYDAGRPATYPELLAAYDVASAALRRGPGGRRRRPTEAWTWSDDHTVGFILRRQAHEALVHRIDAELAAGTPSEVDPRLAADGVAEVIGVMYGGCPPWGSWEPLPHYVRLDCTDTGDELWAQVGLFSGTDPDSGRSSPTRRTSTSSRRRPTSSPTSWSTARPPPSTPGCGTGATTPSCRSPVTGRPSPASARSWTTRSTDPAQRWTAPVRSAATRTAASRAAEDSPSLRVRSGARKRSAKASDFFPSPTCSPV